ncbi:hypothetical protein SISSUDRAFT_166025 [Sistotremastrum suecicum HHB10207 ss-3]|uniref:Uncharacterized protein n=1 Tax=Sistotremastrum suecicum HHB10207 ss-3 TaxID=1314776 RepID=A0A166AM96_9AGAM|nr:hypothetical protein SISSUDRAFT_166025 [Sistotremastrum suecicum HHB10207 ss-3]
MQTSQLTLNPIAEPEKETAQPLDQPPPSTEAHPPQTPVEHEEDIQADIVQPDVTNTELDQSSDQTAPTQTPTPSSEPSIPCTATIPSEDYSSEDSPDANLRRASGASDLISFESMTTELREPKTQPEQTDDTDGPAHIDDWLAPTPSPLVTTFTRPAAHPLSSARSPKGESSSTAQRTSPRTPARPIAQTPNKKSKLLFPPSVESSTRKLSSKGKERAVLGRSDSDNSMFSGEEDKDSQTKKERREAMKAERSKKTAEETELRTKRLRSLSPEVDAFLVELPKSPGKTTIPLLTPDRLSSRTPDPVESEAEERARKRQRRSPERQLSPARLQDARLKSLSPSSATLLMNIIAPTPAQSPGHVLEEAGFVTPDRPTRVISFDPFETPSPSKRPTKAGPAGTPAGRVAVSPEKRVFVNPLDNPNRTPARRIFGLNPTTLANARGASEEPTGSRAGSPSPRRPPRAASAEPSQSTAPPKLPFAIVASKTLAPVPEAPSQSTLRAASKIPRTGTKPYSRPVSRLPLPSSKTLDKTTPPLHAQAAPSRIPSPVKVARLVVPTYNTDNSSSPSPLKRKRDGPSDGAPSRALVARTVVPGMFNKNVVRKPPIATIEHPHPQPEPTETPSDPLDNSQPQPEPTDDLPPSDPPTSSDNEEQTLGRPATFIDDAAKEELPTTDPQPSGSRVSRNPKRAVKVVSTIAPVTPKKSTGNPVSKRAKTPKPGMSSPPSALGMTDNALRALTGANTARNQEYIIELERHIVRKPGKRPDSPTTKIRTITEKRKEEQKGERAARRLKRARDIGDLSIEEEQELLRQVPDDDADFEQEPLTHVRGPGESSDYETPTKPDRNGKAVKWYKALARGASVGPSDQGSETSAEAAARKGILARNAKMLGLDNLGNLPDTNTVIPDVVPAKIVYTKYVYDDDDELLEELNLKPAKARTKKKKA